jgi:hypothetical protein
MTYQLPSPPPGYVQTYSHDFTTQGLGNWGDGNTVIGSPLVACDKNSAGLAVTVTGPNQAGLFTGYDTSITPGSLIQAQMYLPSTSDGLIANWPAFWAIVEPGLPAEGEIDLVEGLGGGASFHIHPSGDGGSFRGSFAGWHTFSALWSKGEVIFWYDAIQMDVLPLPTTKPLGLKYMNQSIGAPPKWYGGPAMYPATTHLSHVKVWSKP